MNRKTETLLSFLILLNLTGTAWTAHGDDLEPPKETVDSEGAGCGLDSCPFHSNRPSGSGSSEKFHKDEEAPAVERTPRPDAYPQGEENRESGSFFVPDSLDREERPQPDLSPAGRQLNPKLDSDEFWMSRSADDLAQAESAISRVLEASRQGLTALPQRASRLASSILYRIWHASKHEISRKIVRELPEEYRAQDPVYTKPQPIRRTYDVSTNGPVSEMFVATLCEEIAEAGIQSVDIINRCQSVIYDRSAFRF